MGVGGGGGGGGGGRGRRKAPGEGGGGGNGGGGKEGPATAALPAGMRAAFHFARSSRFSVSLSIILFACSGEMALGQTLNAFPAFPATFRIVPSNFASMASCWRRVSTRTKTDPAKAGIFPSPVRKVILSSPTKTPPSRARNPLRFSRERPSEPPHILKITG